MSEPQPQPQVCPQCRKPNLLMDMVVQAQPFSDGMARPVGNPVLPLDPLPNTQVFCNTEGCRWQGYVCDTKLADAPEDQRPTCPECLQPQPHHHPACPNS